MTDALEIRMLSNTLYQPYRIDDKLLEEVEIVPVVEDKVECPLINSI